MSTQDDPSEFNLLPPERQDIMKRWIQEHLTPRKSPNLRYSSYNIKHRFEADRVHGGFYVNNGTFKGAMKNCGYVSQFEDDTNWIFSISNKSQFIREARW